MTNLKFSLAVPGLLVLTMALSGPAIAGSDEEQLARMNDPDQWPAPGRDFALTRHSTLADINTKNVGKLQMIWLQGTNALRGHEGQPLVIKDVGGKTMLFMVSGCPAMVNCNVVQALDLTDPDNPKQVWSYVKKTDRDESAVRRACCDTVNHGGSYADGKFVYGTLDGFVIALDGQTGKEVWVVKYAYPEKGETITPAPLIADDKVFMGFGGDEFAARGRVAAFNLKDGSEAWVCHSTGSDADVCLTPETNKANPQFGQAGSDLGIKTFPGEDYRIGGATAWGWYSYDPDLKLVYYATGNPGLWSPSYRCPDKTHEECNTGEFDNKWSATIFARKIENGEAVWAYQMTPFDQWDYAGINENILTDMEVDGKKRKVLSHFDRNGFAYVMDRVDGSLLRATKYVTTDWAEKIDMKTGRPIKVREHSPLEVGRNVSTCPSAMGGKDQQPASVDPKEPNLFYVPTNNWCMELDPQERTDKRQGESYVFANVYMYPEVPGTAGKIKKYDVLTGKTLWEIPDLYPNWGGTMVTDGGLMFYGSLGGDFRVLDRNSGKVLWSRKLGSGIIGNPITYKVGGKQYVGVYSGIGGWIGLPVTAGLDLKDKFGSIGATAITEAVGLQRIPQGGELNVFRLFVEGSEPGRILETAYSALQGLGEEESGYGLYSYVMLTGDSNRSATFLAIILQAIPKMEDIAAVPSQTNMLYIPTRKNTATDLDGLSNASLESEARAEIYSQDIYDYKMSRAILNNICNPPAEELKALCGGSMARGPYLLTYGSPASNLKPVPPPFLFVDLSDVHPQSFPEYVSAFRSVVKQKDITDDAKLHALRLKLLDVIQTAADLFPLVQKAAADIMIMVSEKGSK